jgi:hypothetical protein
MGLVGGGGGCLSARLSSARQWLCSRWPKGLVFVLVLVTHVELLRYLHHVVIPGEQMLCAVW